MSAAMFLVDAFASRPFTGNPAAVCLLESWPDDDWLQAVAMEMNQAETAYLVREGTGFRLRWFTPRVEVDLCGHATLASARILWDRQLADPAAQIVFLTRSGPLFARLAGDEIELDFPLTPQEETAAPPGLLDSLGAQAVYVGRNVDYLVEVADEAELRRLAPDFRTLEGLPCRGVIVTTRSSDPQFDFVSRFFAPASGIDEDPVTGSAHCTLAHYWRGKLGKSRFRAYQASRRGGVVGVEIQGDRVLLRGPARIVVRGELLG